MENHKEMTKHIRSRIKKAGISAGVRGYKSCGCNWIQVYAKINKGEHFTEEEQVKIKEIAKINGLSLSCGLEIEVNVPCGDQVDFVF